MCGREVWEKSVVEKCWRRVLYRPVVEVSEKSVGNTGVKKMSGIKIILFNFSCMQLVLDSTARYDTATALDVYAAFCFDIPYTAHLCNPLQHFIFSCLPCFRDIRRLFSQRSLPLLHLVSVVSSHRPPLKDMDLTFISRLDDPS